MRPKGIVIGFWIFTALFCLQIGFTAYAQLYLPQVAQHFWRRMQATTLEGVPHGGVYPEPLLNATRTS